MFKRIAEQILPYLDVPQDIPVNPQLIQASYRKNNNETEDGSLDDLSAVDFNAQPEVAEESAKPEAVKMNVPKSPEVLMSADEGGDIAVPDFSGKTM